MSFELSWQLVGHAIQELEIIVVCEMSSEFVRCGIASSRNLVPQCVKTKWPLRENTSAWYIKFSWNQCLCYLLQSCLNRCFSWDLSMCCWLKKIDDFFFFFGCLNVFIVSVKLLETWNIWNSIFRVESDSEKCKFEKTYFTGSVWIWTWGF